MAKRKKKKKLRLDRVFIALVVVFALVFGVYKSASFIIHKVMSLFDTDVVEITRTPKNYVATVIIDPGHGGTQLRK